MSLGEYLVGWAFPGAFVRSVNFVFFGLTGLAVYGTARELHAPRSSSALFAAVAVSLPAARKFNDGRYEGVDPTFDAVIANAPSGQRVAVAGTWGARGHAPTWPMCDPRIGNVVEYLGPVEDGLLREYDARDELITALRTGDYDLLLVGRGDPHQPSVVEERWARSAGFREAAASERFALLKRTGIQ